MDTGSLAYYQHLLDQVADLLANADELDALPPRLDRALRDTLTALLDESVARLVDLQSDRVAPTAEHRMWELAELKDDVETALAFHRWPTASDDADDGLPPTLDERFDESA